jgi:hypothetical protein
MLSQCRERLIPRRLAVHQLQRQADAEPPAQRQCLTDDDVQKRLSLARLQQRLGAAQAHRGRQAAVELDHRELL